MQYDIKRRTVVANSDLSKNRALLRTDSIPASTRLHMVSSHIQSKLFHRSFVWTRLSAMRAVPYSPLPGGVS